MADPEDDCKARCSAAGNPPSSASTTSTIQTHLFLCLPPEMREPIWAALDSNDCRAMRQVCGLFKRDIEQVLGVRVVVKENPTVGSPDPGQAELLQMKTQWLQSVIVRSLELIDAGNIMDYSEIVLKNPFMLNRLVLNIGTEEFEDPAKAENLKRVLHSCTGLSSLEILVRMAIASNFELTLSQVLACLERKAQLKDFTFGTSPKYLSHGGRGYRIMPDPHYTPKVTFPMQLRTIHLRLPLPSRRQHLDWQAFLNTQTQLTRLELRIGLVGWDFFERVLLNSVSTLREVCLQVSTPVIIVERDEDLQNSIGQFGATYYDPELPEWEWAEANGINALEHPACFDWSVLAQTRLDLLTVYLTWTYTSHSCNFSQIHLSGLRELNIYGFRLTLKDLTRIFIEGVNLTTLRLYHWSLIAEREDRGFCLIQTIKILILVATFLQTKPFGAFLMMDYAFTLGPQCPIVAAVKELVAPHNPLEHYDCYIKKAPPVKWAK